MWKTPHGHHPKTHLQHLLQLSQAMLQHRVTTQIQLQPAPPSAMLGPPNMGIDIVDSWSFPVKN